MGFKIQLFVFTVSLISSWPLYAKDVIAIEYPPFTSEKERRGGIAFELLHRAYPDENFKAEILPPKRAFRRISNGQWCYSFYPPVQGKQFQSILLSDQQVSIGLVRLKQSTDFKWNALKELSGLKVALLRTEDDALFVSQFREAGLGVVYIETINQGVNLLRKKRVDLAVYDNYSFSHLSSAEKAEIQFSHNRLISTAVTLFVNPQCNHSLPKPKEKLIF
jgi:polar amino acid transport system substrate-binding protein